MAFVKDSVDKGLVREDKPLTEVLDIQQTPLQVVCKARLNIAGYFQQLTLAISSRQVEKLHWGVRNGLWKVCRCSCIPTASPQPSGHM